MLITEIIIMPENFKYELNVTCPIACNLQLNVILNTERYNATKVPTERIRAKQ